MGLFSRRALIAAPIALCRTWGQPPTFRVDVQLVRMLVTVKNSSGALTGGLTKDDFTITDNGVPQEIAVFERNTAQPLSIALLVDTSRSTERERRFEISSVRKFFTSLVREGNPVDAVALYSFNYQVMLQASFTRRLDRLEAALSRLKSEGATALYDAIYLAADDLLTRGGRHVVVVVSDGGDTISAVNFEAALHSLHDANAVLYSVLVVPVRGDAGRNLRGENALTTLAQWTGGKIFFPDASDALDEAFSQILKELRTQYLLGYYPKNVPPSKDRFHRVSVSMKSPGHSVSARNGYFTPQP